MKRSRRAFALLWDAADRFNRNDGWAMAGYIAFNGLLSIFPFIIFATTVIGILVGSSRTDDIIHAIFDIAPVDVATTLEPVIDEVLSNQSGGLIRVSTSLLFALYVASNAIEAFRAAFDRAYRVNDPRGFVVARAIAIAFVVVGAFVSALLGISIILSPLIMRLAMDLAGIRIPGVAGWLSYIFGLLVFFGFQLVMHRYLPGERMHISRLWPGVLVTTGLWTVAAWAFSVYLSFTPTYTITYGALAGVIITLMFFYITGLAIIFGAEFNAAILGAGKAPRPIEQKSG